MKKLTSLFLVLVLVLSILCGTLVACGGKSKKIEVTFDANGGTLEGDEIVKVKKGALIANAPVATLDGYTFLGWFTAAEEGDKIDLETFEVTEEITLYAQYVEGIAPVTVLVTFDANEGVLEGDATVEVEVGGKIASAPVATKDGFTFKGWFTAAEGGESVDLAVFVVTEAVTLFAQYEAAAPSYDGVLPEGALKFEAELATLSPTSGSNYPRAESKPDNSYGGIVGYMGQDGNTITLTFTAAAAKSNVNIYFNMGAAKNQSGGVYPAMSIEECNNSFTLTMNDVEFSLIGNELPAGPGSYNSAFVNLLGKVDLKEGENVLKVVCINGGGCNFDFFAFDADSGVVPQVLPYGGELPAGITKIEAEKAATSYTTAGNTARPGTSSNNAASGGSFIRRMATNGNKMTINFKLVEGMENGYVYIALSNSANAAKTIAQVNAAFSFTLNGTVFTLEGKSLSAGSGNNVNFTVLRAPVNYVTGANTLVIEVTNGGGCNFDYIALDPGVALDIPNGVPLPEGAIKFEAESAVLSPDSSVTNYPRTEAKTGNSGGYIVGYMGQDGNTITLNFNAAAAKQDVKVYINMGAAKNQSGGIYPEMTIEDCNNSFTLTMNGVEFTLAGSNLPEGVGSYNSTFINLYGTVDLLEGANELKVVCKNGGGCNFDFFAFEADSGVSAILAE